MSRVEWTRTALNGRYDLNGTPCKFWNYPTLNTLIDKPNCSRVLKSSLKASHIHSYLNVCYVYCDILWNHAGGDSASPVGERGALGRRRQGGVVRPAKDIARYRRRAQLHRRSGRAGLRTLLVRVPCWIIDYQSMAHLLKLQHRFGHLMTSEDDLRRMLRRDLWAAVTEITERISK